MNTNAEPSGMMNECSLCKTRAILRQVSELIDQIPEIHSSLYDDAIADLSNQTSNALSLFQCMCDEIGMTT